MNYPSSTLWKEQLLSSYSSVSDLLKNNLISQQEAIQLNRVGKRFKVRITPYYAKLMSTSPQCPIRLQAIPTLGEEDPHLPLWAESLSQEIYNRPTPWHEDAIGDLEKMAAPRITHRYQERAIIHLSSMCAVYCRFCFRKTHLNHQDKTLYQGTLEPAIEYIHLHPEIREVILTGGDPLSISDTALHSLFEQFQSIPHIRTVRIHSRMTVTLPSRFTKELIEVFKKNWNFQIVLVSHFNHPKELTSESVTSLNLLKKSHVLLLNQSVLLKDINDTTDCLKNLFVGLYEQGVLPYYLHHPDWTPGTFAFRKSIEEGQKLISQLRGIVSGPAMPDYILDIPQGKGKISLMGASVKKIFQHESKLSHSKKTLKASVYEMTSSSTRDGKNEKFKYLDLSY